MQGRRKLGPRINTRAIDKREKTAESQNLPANERIEKSNEENKGQSALGSESKAYRSSQGEASDRKRSQSPVPKRIVGVRVGRRRKSNRSTSKTQIHPSPANSPHSPGTATTAGQSQSREPVNKGSPSSVGAKVGAHATNKQGKKQRDSARGSDGDGSGIRDSTGQRSQAARAQQSRQVQTPPVGVKDGSREGRHISVPVQGSIGAGVGGQATGSRQNGQPHQTSDTAGTGSGRKDSTGQGSQVTRTQQSGQKQTTLVKDGSTGGAPVNKGEASDRKRLQSPVSNRLVGVSSPSTGKTQIHPSPGSGTGSRGRDSTGQGSQATRTQQSGQKQTTPVKDGSTGGSPAHSIPVQGSVGAEFGGQATGTQQNGQPHQTSDTAGTGSGRRDSTGQGIQATRTQESTQKQTLPGSGKEGSKGRRPARSVPVQGSVGAGFSGQATGFQQRQEREKSRSQTLPTSGRLGVTDKVSRGTVRKRRRKKVHWHGLEEYEGEHYESEGESFSSGYEEGFSQNLYSEDYESGLYWEEEEEQGVEEQEWILSEKDKKALCKKFVEIYMDIGTQNRIVNEIRRKIRCLIKNVDLNCITMCDLKQIQALTLCLEMEKLRQLCYLNKAKEFLAKVPAGPWDEVPIVTNDLDDFMPSKLSCTVNEAIVLSYTEDCNSRLLFK